MVPKKSAKLMKIGIGWGVNMLTDEVSWERTKGELKKFFLG
jgi:hypothetical protein